MRKYTHQKYSYHRVSVKMKIPAGCNANRLKKSKCLREKIGIVSEEEKIELRTGPPSWACGCCLGPIFRRALSLE